MKALKSLARGLMSVWLKLGLISLAVAVALVMVLGNPSAIKQALSTSGIYDKATDGALAEIDQNPVAASGGTSATIPKQQVLKAAKNSFTPTVLKNATEQITDGIYSWLQGKTPQPNFRVDLTAEKQKFTEVLADSVADRARKLPACNLQQLRELANSTPDPWELPCVPLGYDIGVIRDRAVADLASSDEFLKDTVITAEDFPKDGAGKSVFQTASDAPKVFGWLLLAPWIIAFLTLLATGGLLLLHDSKRQALKAVAMALLGSGLFLLIITAIYSLVFKQGFRLNSPDTSNIFQQPLYEAIHYLQNAISYKLLWFGVVYTILGILSLLALHFNKRVEEIQTTAASGDNQPSDNFNASVLPPPAPSEEQNKNR